jgi:hypothetical protein
MTGSFSTAAFDAAATARKILRETPLVPSPSRYEKSRGNYSHFA